MQYPSDAGACNTATAVRGTAIDSINALPCETVNAAWYSEFLVMFWTEARVSRWLPLGQAVDAVLHALFAADTALMQELTPSWPDGDPDESL